MSRPRPTPRPEATRSLSAAVRGRVTTDADGLAPFGHDASHVTGRPLAVVAPADADDVVELVRWARRTRIPLVPRGAGTSLDGESVPPDGGVVIDLSGWSRLLEVDPDGLWARVEPGIVNRDLQRALLPHRRFYPPNPGSWTASTVGGNVGTNASGMRSFRYGPTRAWVREVEAVLGTGSRVHLGSRVPKRSVGPDLLQLFVGSEGTLGVATEVTVRLAPLPAVRHGVVVPVPKAAPLGPLVTRLSETPDSGLSAVEYPRPGVGGRPRRTTDGPLAERLLAAPARSRGGRSRGGRAEALPTAADARGDGSGRRVHGLRGRGRTLDPPRSMRGRPHRAVRPARPGGRRGPRSPGGRLGRRARADRAPGEGPVLPVRPSRRGKPSPELRGRPSHADRSAGPRRRSARRAFSRGHDQRGARGRGREAAVPRRGARRGRGRAPLGREAGVRPRRDPEPREALSDRASASTTTFSVTFGRGRRPSSAAVTQRRSAAVAAPGLPRWRPAKTYIVTVKWL